MCSEPALPSARPMRLAAWALLCVGLLTATGATAAPAVPELRARIADALVVPAPARAVPYRWDHEPAILALYFGADWCAPCHAFVPELRRVRDALQAAGADTEVVYVSLDTSERAMHRYMRQQAMPWPAIDHRRLQALPALTALGGIAPPNLVLIDRDGTLLASGWDGRSRLGLQPVLETWRRAVADEAAGDALSLLSQGDPR